MIRPFAQPFSQNAAGYYLQLVPEAVDGRGNMDVAAACSHDELVQVVDECQGLEGVERHIIPVVLLTSGESSTTPQVPLQIRSNAAKYELNDRRVFELKTWFVRDAKCSSEYSYHIPRLQPVRVTLEPLGVLKRENIGQDLANADEASQVTPLVKPGIGRSDHD